MIGAFLPNRKDAPIRPCRLAASHCLSWLVAGTTWLSIIATCDEKMKDTLKRYDCRSLDELALNLRRFADEREWEQYHSPKNLASALIVEAAELLEHFQWLSQEQSRNLPPAIKAEVAHEIADVLIYLTRLADRLGIDMLAAASEKMALNATKYPPLSPAP